MPSRSVPARSFHLHLVSDATGETLSTVARACVAQFPGAEAVEHMWSLVRTQGQVQRVLTGIRAHPGVVLCTIVDRPLREQLETGCRSLGVPCSFVLAPALNTLAAYLGQAIHGRPGGQHEMNEEYYRRIEAMEYTLAHDDGHGTPNLERADVVLVGVSRTSKTPTCLYLANRGLKAANVPLVPNVPLPAFLLTATKPLIVGLTTDAARLVQIRRNRLSQFGDAAAVSTYANLEDVRAELATARRLCQEHGWPVIDVSRRSIEETAAAIYQLYVDRLERQSEAAPGGAVVGMATPP
ncbi:MAG: kinase/pyrophosphorylase [Alphaproteobacteria bacterium]|nr:kinase/pyrophosphorylase [Alphaproteobacteria bacterium]